ncbi:MAG: amidase family protein, partial [Vicinamibacteria bacterium]|nr:amidase family protein [Vicinamibacteria bacterium]
MSAAWTQTAAGLAARVRARELSAEESVRGYLERVTATDGRVHAFLRVREEAALAAARDVDTRVARGEALPLAGVPVAIKDVMHVEGEPTTCGSRILEGYVAPYTATAVARLQAAGAVV